MIAASCLDSGKLDYCLLAVSGEELWFLISGFDIAMALAAEDGSISPNTSQLRNEIDLAIMTCRSQCSDCLTKVECI